MTTFLIVSAFTVSIDSLVCGFSLAYRSEGKLSISVGISFVVLILCLFTNYFAIPFSGLLTEKTAGFGGIILIGVGLYNLLKKERRELLSRHGIIKQSLISGFAVGLDGALLNLSLSLMGTNAFYVPVFIAAMHFFTISLGILLSKIIPLDKIESVDFVPQIILIVLGLYKLLTAFI